MSPAVTQQLSPVCCIVSSQGQRHRPCAAAAAAAAAAARAILLSPPVVIVAAAAGASNAAAAAAAAAWSAVAPVNSSNMHMQIGEMPVHCKGAAVSVGTGVVLLLVVLLQLM